MEMLHIIKWALPPFTWSIVILLQQVFFGGENPLVQPTSRVKVLWTHMNV
jgi:hypothetical protein